MQVDRAAVKSFWEFIFPYLKPASASMLLVITTVLLSLCPPLLYRQLIDQGIRIGNGRALVLYSCAIVAILLASALLQMAEEYVSCRFGLVMMNDVRNKLYRKLQALPLSFFHTNSVGAVISRFTTDLLNVQKAVARTLPSILTNMLMVLFSLGIMFYLNVELTFISLFALPLYAFVSVRVAKIVADISGKAIRMGDRMITTLGEDFSIDGLLFFKLTGGEANRRRSFETLTDDIQGVRLRLAMWARANAVTVEFLQLLSIVSIYYLGGLLVRDASLSLGTIVAFAAMANRLYQPIVFFSSTVIDLPTSVISVRRIQDFLDAPEVQARLPTGHSVAPPPGSCSIVFDRVSFRYPGSKHGVDDISFTVNCGERISLVGANGSGKTTLLLLLAGIYKPSSGSIFLCGRDVNGMSREEVAAQLGVAFGSGFFLNTSIKENLGIVRPQASSAALTAALQRAGCLDFLARLPGGEEAVIGQSGMKLSAGQRQRIALARLYLADPPVMCLDESTTNIDAEAEEAIIAALRGLESDKTVLVISHSLKTVMWAPRILLLESGRLVADGEHARLVAESMAYRKLFMSTVEATLLTEGVH